MESTGKAVELNRGSSGNDLFLPIPTSACLTPSPAGDLPPRDRIQKVSKLSPSFLTTSHNSLFETTRNNRSFEEEILGSRRWMRKFEEDVKDGEEAK